MYKKANTIKIIPTLLNITIFLFVFFIFSNITNAAVFGLSSKGLPSTGLNNGLVGWWTFDGKDMTPNIVDKTGRGNVGFLSFGATGQIATTTGQGKIGQALKLDGINDLALLKDSADFDVGGAFSSCGWINTPANVNGKAVISHTDSASKATYKWIAGYVTSNSSSLQSFVRISGTTYSTGVSQSAGFFANSWHHFCTVFDRTLSAARIKVYVDGGNGGIAFNTAVDGDVDAGDYPTLGQWGGSGSFPGLMDDVRLYNRALTATEVMQIYSLGSSKTDISTASSRPGTGLDSGDVGQWTFDGKNMLNGAMQDISGNGNSAYFTGIASSTFFATGKIGQAGNFDGLTNKATIMSPSSFQFDYSTPFSITFWMKSSPGWNGSARILLSKFTTGSPNVGWYIIANNYVAGALSFENQDVGNITNTVTNPTVVFDDKWHLVTATYSGNSNRNGMKIYIDDAAATVGSASSMVQSFNDVVAQLTIGGLSSTDLYDYPGLLDDINIYNRELSSSEIQQLYKQGAGTKIATSVKGLPSTGLNSGLVDWWTFDGKDILNGRIIDRGSNGFNGSPVNISSSTFYAIGKIGQGVKFDQVSGSYIDLGTNKTLTAGSPFTLSWWEKITDNSKITGANADYPSRFSLKMNGNTGDFLVLRIRNGGAGNYWPVSFSLSPSGAFAAPGAAAAPSIASSINIWHHFVITGSDPASVLPGTYSFYSDGVSLPVSTAFNIFGAVTSNRIGFDSGGDSNPGATMDEVRIYNRQLTAQEVMQLYKRGR